MLPDGAVPTNTTQLAVLAIELHEALLQRDAETGQTTVVDPDPEVIRVEMLQRMEAGRASKGHLSVKRGRSGTKRATPTTRKGRS